MLTALSLKSIHSTLCMHAPSMTTLIGQVVPLGPASATPPPLTFLPGVTWFKNDGWVWSAVNGGQGCLV